MYHKIKIIPIKDLSLVFLLYMGLVISGCTSRLRLNTLSDDSVDDFYRQPAPGFVHYYDGRSEGFSLEEVYSNIDDLFHAFDERVLCLEKIEIDKKTYERFKKLREENLANCYILSKNCSKEIYRSMLLSAIQASCVVVVKYLLSDAFAIPFFGSLSSENGSYVNTLSYPILDCLDISFSHKLYYRTTFLHEAVYVIKKLEYNSSNTSAAFSTFYELLLGYLKKRSKVNLSKQTSKKDNRLIKQDSCFKENILHFLINSDANHDDLLVKHIKCIFGIFESCGLTIREKIIMLIAKDSQNRTPEDVAIKFKYPDTAALLNEYLGEYRNKCSNKDWKKYHNEAKKLSLTLQDDDSNQPPSPSPPPYGKPDPRDMHEKRKKNHNNSISDKRMRLNQAQVKSMGKKIKTDGSPATHSYA